MFQTHHVYPTLERRGNDGFRLVSTWNTRGVFVGILLHLRAFKAYKVGEIMSNVFIRLCSLIA